jgi:hypothetical protein
MLKTKATDAINKILVDLDELGFKELKGDDTVFDVVTELCSGCWLLFFSALIYVVLSTVVLR